MRIPTLNLNSEVLVKLDGISAVITGAPGSIAADYPALQALKLADGVQPLLLKTSLFTKPSRVLRSDAVTFPLATLQYSTILVLDIRRSDDVEEFSDKDDCHELVFETETVPATGEVTLWNRTSTPCVARIDDKDKQSPVRDVAPHSSLRLLPGAWQLSIGTSLCFQILVLPVSEPGDVCHFLMKDIETDPTAPGGFAHRSLSKKPTSSDKPKASKALVKPAVKSRTAKHRPDKMKEAPVRPSLQQGLGQQLLVETRLIPFPLDPVESNIITPSPPEPVKANVISRKNHSVITKVQLPYHGLVACKSYVNCERQCCAREHNASTRMAKELAMLLRLHEDEHPAIIPFIEADTRTLTTCFEYFPLGDLDQFIKTRNTDDLQQISDVVKADIGSALDFLHNTHDLVHNDVKPGNILLRYDAVADTHSSVLCDFEYAAPAQARPLGGTHYCIPPEYEDTGIRSYAADMWALGVVLLQIDKVIPLEPGAFWLIVDLLPDRRTEAKGIRSRALANGWLKRIRKQVVFGCPETKELLVEDPEYRMTAAQLVEALSCKRQSGYQQLAAVEAASRPRFMPRLKH